MIFFFPVGCGDVDELVVAAERVGGDGDERVVGFGSMIFSTFFRLSIHGDDKENIVRNFSGPREGVPSTAAE